MKTRVKILVSIAGVGDPDRAALEKKYAAMRTWFEAKRRSENFIEREIDEAKRLDRYDAPPTGFARDWSYKPGEEALIDAELAKKWEAAGVCTIVPPEAKKIA
jgi:hypothetical protein